MVQNIIAKKKVIEVVETFSKLPESFDYELSIIGHGSENILNDLKELILRRKIANKVKLYGRLKESEILSFSRSHDIFSRPFRDWSFIGVFLVCRPWYNCEAMSDEVGRNYEPLQVNLSSVGAMLGSKIVKKSIFGDS